MSVESEPEWDWICKMPQPTLHPRLEFVNTTKSVIQIKQRHRNNMNYYFELDLKTNICTTKQLNETTQIQQSLTILSDTDIIGFDNDRNLYFLDENNKWCTTRIPGKTYSNFCYIITNDKRYIILFGGHVSGRYFMSSSLSNQRTDNIWICDTIKNKWYDCYIKLPKPISFIININS